VTMREIAKQAGCSHTTIYSYYKDKVALLHHLSMEPMQALRDRMESVLSNTRLSPEDRLKSVTQTFLEFSLTNRNMYTIFFTARATRVDEEKPELEINRLRLYLFELLRRAIGEFLQRDWESNLILSYARVYFFNLHGMMATYRDSEESASQLMERLKPTFDFSVEVMLVGFKQIISRGDDIS